MVGGRPTRPLAFNFLLLAAPLLVLGVPGSFGRYVDHYRQRGQLLCFLRRTLLLTVVASLLGTGVLVAAPDWFARLLYDDASRPGLIQLLGGVLLAVVTFNFLVELLTALRLVRFASLMQLVSSLTFAVIGIVLLCATQHREAAVLFAYGAAACTASVVGIIIVVRYCRDLPESETQLPHSALWSKLAPFAFWVWAGNLTTNLFEVADQFMLKHFAGLAPSAADSLIGQYYCSRVVPLLMISGACMFASSLLPHLTRDWDAGRYAAVRQRMQLVLKAGALSLTLAAALVLVAAPLLFTVVLRGKYDTGLTVLPATLTYCVWYCLGCLATSYLLCAERAKWGSLALLIGFVTNLLLNYWWAPRFGLAGVVAATATANAVGLAAMLVLSRDRRLDWDRGVWLAPNSVTGRLGSPGRHQSDCNDHVRASVDPQRARSGRRPRWVRRVPNAVIGCDQNVKRGTKEKRQEPRIQWVTRQEPRNWVLKEAQRQEGTEARLLPATKT